MEVIVYIIVGILNGLFSSGAGQILIFYLIYILKQDTKKSREFSLSVMPIISIPTFIYFFSKSDINLITCLIFVVISLIFGYLGNVVMKKMNNNILNLIDQDLQTFITTTEIKNVDKKLLENAKIFHVSDGIVEEE